MQSPLSFEDVRRAWETRDPDLPRLIIALSQAPDPRPEKPVREGALTYQEVVRQLGTWAFRRKEPAERRQIRTDLLAALEAPDAEAPPPGRLLVYKLILEMWKANGPFERASLLEIVAAVPLRWGPWRALKRIFKDAEERGDLEMFGALAARFDQAFARRENRNSEVSTETLRYLCHRGWRFLRRQAESLPASYADAAAQVLRFYDENTAWASTWIANHIFYHESKRYSRRSFRYPRPKAGYAERAYTELWKRTPRPLFGLLERARADRIRRYAAETLQSDFRASLREVEPAWIARLISVPSAEVHKFVVWVLGNVPKFQQGVFRTLGLHEPVLGLLASPSTEACEYAAAYARTHARDLPLEALLRHANSSVEAVRALARDLIQVRDPRREIGLEAWGQLLGTQYGHSLADTALRSHFGARELTPDWFKERILAHKLSVFQFASDLLVKLHTLQSLGQEFFRSLLEDERVDRMVATFALSNLERYGLQNVPIEFLRRALLNPHCSAQICAWTHENKIPPERLGAPFLKRMAFEPEWETDPVVLEVRQSGRPWTAELRFDETLSHHALAWLSDVRRFTPDQIGFDWLLRLARRTEPHYHEFAVETMIKAFLPADFAPATTAAPTEETAEPASVDLNGQTFLFTGKLQSMTRKEAQQRVTGARGKNASAVNAKLHYLVIGDEGSPLFGGGKKGSKQKKAEKLISEGAELRIISETAFLQMMEGRQRATASDDAITAGCERLWEMATGLGPEDAPLGRFARRYIRFHHPGIALERENRPVDPGAEIPDAFLTFERVRPVLLDERPELRRFALELCEWELAGWAPGAIELLELSDAPHSEVRALIEKALLADDSKEHDRYRIASESLTPDGVYAFCESLVPATRNLGMQLILRHRHLSVPREMFRLTESPDRNVGAFVIRQIWSLYRDRGVTVGWKPSPVPEPPLSKHQRKAPEPEAHEESGVPPRPEEWPASEESLRDLLRRQLFSLPPARPEKQRGDAGSSKKPKLKPLSARKAKLALVSVLRDLAIEDAAFAALVVPLLREFLPTRGKSEKAACLVALTRIGHTHAGLEARAGENT